jgi:hypothetical protein
MKNVIFAGMTKNFILVLVLGGVALAAPAQEKRPSWFVQAFHTANRLVTAPKKSLNPDYVYQSPLQWEIAAEGKTIGLRADLHSDFVINDLTGDKAEIVEGSLDTGLKNQPYWKLGLAAGYGSLRLGYGIDLAKKKDSQNRYFSLGTNSSFYGAEIQYYKIHQSPTGTLFIEGLPPVDLSSDLPGEMRNLSLEGYYAFNRHKFVFNAAYSGRNLQRRSAGSAVVIAKYLQGDFSIDEDDTIWNDLGDLQRYTTQQISVGGGYSFNWVLFHRDPTDPKTEIGLRNLTVNATALPMLSFFNHIQTEQETDDGLVQVRYNGRPAFSPTLRGALCYTGGRIRAIAGVYYDFFGFRGVETTTSEQQGKLRTEVKTNGTFSDLTVAAKVSVRF